MSWRSDSTQLIAGSWLSSAYAGHGIQAQGVPSTGTSGAGYLYNDIASEGAAPTDEMRSEILTWPSAGVFTPNEDSSASLVGAPDGTYYATYRGYINGAAYGDFTIVMIIGTGAPPVGTPPVGTVTVGTITVTQTTASVPYTYSAADETGIEYRLDGGSAVTATASPQEFTGLTAGTTYGIQFRAVNGFGSSSWSTSAPFTTEVVPVVESLLSISIQNIPDGSFNVFARTHPNGAVLVDGPVSFSGGKFESTVGLPVGTKVSGYVIDSEAVPVNGSVFYSETSNAN